jgi:DNA-binding NarL/FixJ family response regulator
MASTTQTRRARGGRRNGEAWQDIRSGQPLSEREEQVLQLLAEGLNNAEIARELYISRETVKKHVSSILVKVEAENRVQAAVFAVRSGLV